MKLRNTILAFVLLAALGSWIYFYEYKGEEGREKAETAAKKVFDFETDKADGLDIVRPDGTLSVKKENGEWRVTSPIQARADAEEVSGILSTLSWLEVDKKIEAGEADLDQFKLKEPPLKITLHPGDQKPEMTLAIGDKTPIASSYYARRGDGQVVTISSSIDRLMETTADKIRYKKIVGLDSWKVTRLSVSRGGSVTSFGKTGEDWKLESPVAFPADRTKVSSLLGDVTAMTADGFEADGTKPGSVGLDHPEATLQLQEGEGKAVTVELSAKDPSGTVRARRTDMPEIFKVKGEILDKLALKADDYRDLRVAPLDRWSVSEIRGKAPAGEKVVVKDSESNWRWGTKDGPTIDRKEVEDLLEALDATKAVTFADGAEAARKAVGASPELTLSLRAGESAPVEVRVGAEDAGKVRVGSSVSSSVYEVDKPAVEKLMAAFQALKAPSPTAAATSGPSGAAPPSGEPPAPSGPAQGGGTR